MAPQTVCYYCVDYLNREGYHRLNQRDPARPQLTLVAADVRCDFCDRRENGKLYVPRAYFRICVACGRTWDTRADHPLRSQAVICPRCDQMYLIMESAYG